MWNWAQSAQNHEIDGLIHCHDPQLLVVGGFHEIVLIIAAASSSSIRPVLLFAIPVACVTESPEGNKIHKKHLLVSLALQELGWDTLRTEGQVQQSQGLVLISPLRRRIVLLAFLGTLAATEMIDVQTTPNGVSGGVARAEEQV